jgi:hypothetical protein
MAKPIKFDPRTNNADGKAKEEAYSKAEGARLVGDVMLRQEAKAAPGMKFRIGENQAKKIDMDRAPE